jgi:NTE family protein
MRTTGFESGAVMLRQGHLVPVLYLLISGTVSVLLGDGANAQRLAQLGPGAWLGETALLTGAVSSTTVVAETEVQALAMSQAEFLAATQEDPAIFRELAHELARRLRSTDHLLDQRTASRVVLLWHDRRHTSVVRDVLQECKRWAPVPLLALSSGDIGSGLSVSEYLADPARLTSLGRRVTSGRPATIPLGDPASPQLSPFLSLVSRFASLVVIAVSQPISASVMPRITETVSLGRHTSGRTFEEFALDVPHRVWSAGPAFDAARVARWICHQRIGFALGGGAARGFAHLGVLRTLLQAGVPIDVLAGTSVGAPIAAAVAADLPLDETAATIETAGRTAMVPQLVPAHSLFMSTFIEMALKRRFHQRRFEELTLPLGVTAVDLDTAEELVFTAGALIPALMASMAVPGIFPPVRHAGRLLVDGGLRMPLPVKACRDLGADIVIASRLRVAAPSQERDEASVLPWLPETISRALDIMQDRLGMEASAAADVLIETAIPRRHAGLFDFRHRQFVEDAGEREAQAALQKIVDGIPGLRRAVQPARRAA